MITYHEAVTKLQSSGLRMTHSRDILLKLVLSSTGPFSVKMLYTRAQTDHPDENIHLATVHRNLAEFADLGLVDKIPGEDNSLYSLHHADDSGAHVFCLDCRNFVPLENSTLNGSESVQGLSAALTERGFDAGTVRLMVAAHCRNQAKVSDCDDPKSEACAT